MKSPSRVLETLNRVLGTLFRVLGTLYGVTPSRVTLFRVTLSLTCVCSIYVLTLSSSYFCGTSIAWCALDILLTSSFWLWVTHQTCSFDQFFWSYVSNMYFSYMKCRILSWSLAHACSISIMDIFTNEWSMLSSGPSEVYRIFNISKCWILLANMSTWCSIFQMLMSSAKCNLHYALSFLDLP